MPVTSPLPAVRQTVTERVCSSPVLGVAVSRLPPVFFEPVKRHRGAGTHTRAHTSTPVLRLLSTEPGPRIRSSRGRAGVLVGLDGCEVRLFVIRVPVCARVSPFVSRLPPVSFYRSLPPVSFYRSPVQLPNAEMRNWKFHKTMAW